MATFYAIDGAMDFVNGINSLTGIARSVGLLGLESDFSGLSSQASELSDEAPIFVSNLVDSLTDPLSS